MQNVLHIIVDKVYKLLTSLFADDCQVEVKKIRHKRLSYTDEAGIPLIHLLQLKREAMFFISLYTRLIRFLFVNA